MAYESEIPQPSPENLTNILDGDTLTVSKIVKAQYHHLQQPKPYSASSCRDTTHLTLLDMATFVAYLSILDERMQAYFVSNVTIAK